MPSSKIFILGCPEKRQETSSRFCYITQRVVLDFVTASSRKRAIEKVYLYLSFTPNNWSKFHQYTRLWDFRYIYMNNSLFDYIFSSQMHMITPKPSAIMNSHCFDSVSIVFRYFCMFYLIFRLYIPLSKLNKQKYIYISQSQGRNKCYKPFYQQLQLHQLPIRYILSRNSYQKSSCKSDRAS